MFFSVSSNSFNSLTESRETEWRQLAVRLQNYAEFTKLARVRQVMTRIRIFLNPQMVLCRFTNFHVHMYLYSNRVCPSTSIRHLPGSSGSYPDPDSLLYPGLLWEYCYQSMRRNNEVTMLNIVFMLIKELGSILLKIGNGKPILTARRWRSKQNNKTKNIHLNKLPNILVRKQTFFRG